MIFGRGVWATPLRSTSDQSLVVHDQSLEEAADYGESTPLVNGER